MGINLLGGIFSGKKPEEGAPASAIGKTSVQLGLNQVLKSFDSCEFKAGDGTRRTCPGSAQWDATD